MNETSTRMPQAQTMADTCEIKQSIWELKDFIYREIKDFSAEFKDFWADTERDIKKIM